MYADGGAGNDTINGGGANDRLVGGPNDTEAGDLCLGEDADVKTGCER